MSPAEHATRIYAESYERLCEVAQTEKPKRPLAARIVSSRALIALRAFRAESRPLEPMKPTSTKPCCSDCMVYLALPGEAKPVPLVEVFL